MKRKFIYSESLLAEVTGLSRAQLKRCRVKGAWRKGKGKGGPVELSENAVRSVLERFGIEDANLDGARLKRSGGNQPAFNQEQSTPPVISEERGDASLTRTKTREHPAAPTSNPNGAAIQALPDLKLVHVSQIVGNKRILKAQNGTGEIYNVIVPCSETWAIGDPLRIKPSPNHHGYWQLEGKAPRWRSDRMYRMGFV